MAGSTPGSFYWETSAKPKRSRWLRKRMIALYVSLAIVVCAGVFVYRVAYAEPVISVDYRPKMEELTRRLQGMPADAENGWLILDVLVPQIQAANDKVCDAADWKVTNAYVNVMTIYDPTTKLEGHAETWDQVKGTSLEFLRELQSSGVFVTADRLRNVRYGVRTQKVAKLLDFQIPEAGKARYLTRSNIARMYLAHERGDDAERIQAFEQCVGLSRIESRQPSCIEYLVGVAILAAVMDELRREFIEKPADEAACARWKTVLDSVEAPAPEAAFEGERLLDLDTVQHTFSDMGNGEGRLLVTRLNELATAGQSGASSNGFEELFQYRLSNLLGLFLPGRKDNVNQINSYFDGVVKQTRMTRMERRADSFDARAFETGLPKSFLFLHIMLPAGGRVLQSFDQIRLDVAGTRLMLSIEMHRAKTGSYPQTLQELKPGTLAAIPSDPFTGGNFGYRRLKPGEDVGGREYLLYSFGADGIDNNGNEGGNTFAALQQTKGQGFDFVINRARPRVEDTGALTPR